MVLHTPTCQACDGLLDGPPTFPIPGISIARLCISCRQDYQRVIMVTYPELIAEFDEINAEMRTASSGLPSNSGISNGDSVFQRHIDIEAQFIKIWDEFLESKKEVDEQGE